MPNIVTRVRRVNVLYLILIVCYIGASFAINGFDLWEYLPERASLIMGQILVGVPAACYCLVFRERPFDERFRKKLRLPAALLLILLGLASIPLAWFINAVTMLFTPNYVAGTMMEAPEVISFWEMMTFIAVIPAAVEELIFRGIFYNAYSRVNPVRGILLSGFLFGLMHLNPNQIAYAVPLGMLLALVLEMTGSFLAPMLVHFTINGFNTGLAWLAIRYLNDVGFAQALPETEAAAEVGAPFVFYLVLFVLAAASLAAVIGLLIAVAAVSRRGSWRRALLGGKAPVLLAVDGVFVKRRLGNAFLWLGVGIAVTYTLILTV